MLIRIVKMTFDSSEIYSFKDMMQRNAVRIKAFEGCEYLQILQERNRPNIVFTYSHWKDETCLEKYRSSDLFREVWTEAKAKFSEKAEAWSVDKFIEIE